VPDVHPPPTLSGVHLTERDRQILAFLAEHRLVLERQVERLLGVSPGKLGSRMRQLAEDGYLSYQPGFGADLRWCQIRRLGLLAIGSRLPTPRRNLANYRHDVGVAWLWLAARAGKFGPLREVLSERWLRSQDGARSGRADAMHGDELWDCGESLDRDESLRRGASHAVRLGGRDRHGDERLHYPDLLLIDPAGRRIALELELTPKGLDRRERILGGYGADGRIDAVLYLVEDTTAGRSIGRSVEASAETMNLSDLVHVQLVKPIVAIGDEASAQASRAATRQGRSASGGRGDPGRRVAAHHHLVDDSQDKEASR
jgi:hypothetical protein